MLPYGLHCLLNQKQSSVTKIHHFIESLTGKALKYKMDNSKLIVSICMGYGKCYKILNTSCMPNSADPDQTASEEAV